MKPRDCLLVGLLGLLPVSCNHGGLDDDGATALVRAYDSKLIEAFRTRDIGVIHALVGDDEGRKILGLIGVKSDMGIYLDARMIEFTVEGVARPGKGVVTVTTSERWSYADRRIGTGEQVGEASLDSYLMRYSLAKPAGRWVVTRVEFASQPKVGRKTGPIAAPAEVFHGGQSATTPATRPAPTVTTP